MGGQYLLTKKQLELIDALAKGQKLEGILKRKKIAPATFHRWFASEAFEQELQFRHQLAQRQSALLLEQHAYKAAKKLIDLMGKEEKPDVVRRACLDVLNLTNNSKRTAEAKAAKSSEPATVTMDKATAAAMLDLLSNECKKK